MSMKIRTYDELIKLKTFEERYEYLRLFGRVGESTFGFDRYINQEFYRSKEWRRMRDKIIVRDEGRDLGLEGYDIYDRVYVHHMNPMIVTDMDDIDKILNPNYLISASFNTHQAIHFGDESLLPKLPIERRPNDTKLW